MKFANYLVLRMSAKLLKHPVFEQNKYDIVQDAISTLINGTSSNLFDSSSARWQQGNTTPARVKINWKSFTALAI